MTQEEIYELVFSVDQHARAEILKFIMGYLEDDAEFFYALVAACKAEFLV